MQFITSTDPRVVVGRFSYGTPQLMLWCASEKIKIGSFCSFAGEVVVFGGGEHQIKWITTFPLRVALKDNNLNDRAAFSKGPTTIGNDVWLAHRAVVLSGVTIGDGAVIGACAVVAGDVPPYAIVAGNPAKIIRYRFTPDEIAALLIIRWWDWDIEKIKENVPLLCSENIGEFLNKYNLNN